MRKRWCTVILKLRLRSLRKQVSSSACGNTAEESASLIVREGEFQSLGAESENAALKPKCFLVRFSAALGMRRRELR